MNERPRLHLDVVQPKLAAAGIVEGGEYSRNQLVAALGEDLVLRIERATDVAIEHVDATVKSCTELVAAAYLAMKMRFPNQQFVRLAPGVPSDIPQQPTSGADAPK